MEKASLNFIKNLKKQKRENKSLLFLDNVKIIRDSLSKEGFNIKFLLTTLNEESELEKLLHIGDLSTKGFQVFHIDEKTLLQLADTKTPQKVVCIAYLTQNIVLIPKGNFLVLDSLQDPGNVGTLIRTAKACGFECVFLVDCVRRENDKLIRSSVGAVFDSNVFQCSKNEFVELAKKNKFKLICADMDGENIFTSTFKEPVGVVIGNEGQGVRSEIRTLCNRTVKIPMNEGIESLNAGVSGSIIMYEINKNKFI